MAERGSGDGWGSTALGRVREFDLEKLGRRGRRSGADGLRRWRQRAWMITQCALTAAIAWALAQWVLGRSNPIFAPVAAVVCLGMSFGQRLSRAVEIGAGVAVGVFVADIFVTVAGTGVWQIVVVVFVAMSVSTLLGARNLMIIQSGVQATIVMTLMPEPGQGLGRWLEALIGVSLASLVALIAPTAPITRPRIIAAEALSELSSCLRAVRRAIGSDDAKAASEALQRAERSESTLDQLAEAADEGLAVVRYSPFLRSRRQHMQDLSALAVPLHRLTRNLRVLARRAMVSLYRSEEIVGPEYLQLMGRLADEIEFCAGELFARRLPVRARTRIVELGRHSAAMEHSTDPVAVVLLAQMQAMITDLLVLTGLTYRKARELLPEPG